MGTSRGNGIVSKWWSEVYTFWRSISFISSTVEDSSFGGYCTGSDKWETNLLGSSGLGVKYRHLSGRILDRLSGERRRKVNSR